MNVVEGGVRHEHTSGQAVAERGELTLDDACVDVEQIVARHARLSSDAGRHGHEVAALERGVQLLLFRSHVRCEGGLPAAPRTRESAER